MQATGYWLAFSICAGGDNNGQKFAPGMLKSMHFLWRKNSFLAQ